MFRERNFIHMKKNSKVPFDIRFLKEKARWVRLQILEAIASAKKGHIGGALSCTDILVFLFYGKILRFRPRNPKWANRDRFIIRRFWLQPCRVWHKLTAGNANLPLGLDGCLDHVILHALQALIFMSHQDSEPQWKKTRIAAGPSGLVSRLHWYHLRIKKPLIQRQGLFAICWNLLSEQDRAERRSRENSWFRMR